MPYHRVIPDDKVDNDERLEKTEEKPDESEIEELRELLFNEGRYVPPRFKDPNVKDLPYKANLVRDKYIPDLFARHRKVCRGEKKEKKEIFFRVRRDPEPVGLETPRETSWPERLHAELVSREYHARLIISKIKKERFEELRGRHLRGRST
jgi:hypothetical protein